MIGIIFTDSIPSSERNQILARGSMKATSAITMAPLCCTTLTERMIADEALMRMQAVPTRRS